MIILKSNPIILSISLIIILNFGISSAFKLQWIPATSLNQSAHVPSGWLDNIQKVTYVGRAASGRGHVLGGYSPHHKHLSAGDNRGKEVKIPESFTELLLFPKGMLTWISAGRGFELIPGFNEITNARDIPNTLILGGHSTDTREHIFICRALNSQGHLLLGYFRFTNIKKCYAANGGIERAYKQFELLAINQYGIVSYVEGS